jgi:uncharacterized protein YbgA (DUF1722 family)
MSVTFPRPRLFLARSCTDAATSGYEIRSDIVLRTVMHCDLVGMAEMTMNSSAVDGVLLLASCAGCEPDRCGVQQQRRLAAVDEETALAAAPTRERFLTLLFALARLRAVEGSGARRELVDFHAAYKYTLLAYDEAGMRELGRTVAAVADAPWEETTARYRRRMVAAFAKPASTGGHVNALTHAFGHFSGELSAAERQFFLEVLDGVAAGRTPVDTAVALLRSWVLRFDVPYLSAQAYFRPYPELEAAPPAG